MPGLLDDRAGRAEHDAPGVAELVGRSLSIRSHGWCQHVSQRHSIQAAGMPPRVRSSWSDCPVSLRYDARMSRARAELRRRRAERFAFDSSPRMLRVGPNPTMSMESARRTPAFCAGVNPLVSRREPRCHDEPVTIRSSAPIAATSTPSSPARNRATVSITPTPEALSFAADVPWTPSMCATMITRTGPVVRPTTFRDVRPFGSVKRWMFTEYPSVARRRRTISAARRSFRPPAGRAPRRAILAAHSFASGPGIAAAGPAVPSTSSVETIVTPMRRRISPGS